MPGVHFPAGDEGPKHPGRTGTGGIRRLIEAHLTNLDEPRRLKLSDLVNRLYTLRVSADYKPSVDVDGRDAREAVSIMNRSSTHSELGVAFMPTTQQEVTEIVNKVRRRLGDAEREGVYLQVTGHKLDDGWLYIVVVPSRSGVRASEYANFMSKVERELRAAGDDNVLLVPALED
jgi:hypothetical protein